jgi:hypothetical protein
VLVFLLLDFYAPQIFVMIKSAPRLQKG